MVNRYIGKLVYQITQRFNEVIASIVQIFFLKSSPVPVRVKTERDQIPRIR
jgi:hypothetical protein